MADTTPDPDVKEAAADPASVTVDGVTVTTRSVKETIDAERHLATKAAATNPWMGLGIRRVNPGSAVRE